MTSRKEKESVESIQLSIFWEKGCGIIMRPDESEKTYLEMLHSRTDVQAVLMMPDSGPHMTYREGTFYLLVLNQPLDDVVIRCLHFQDKLVVEQQISSWHVERGIIEGLDEQVTAILQQAVIVWEKDEYISRVRERLCSVSKSRQKKYICREYSRLLRFFYETKEYVQQGMMLDAYDSLVKSMQAWARHIVYEAGQQPTASLWSQVKQFEPSVYKLYEELSHSTEALHKRIDLLVLAIEFWLSSNVKESACFLVKVMATKASPWRLSELLQHQDIRGVGLEIPLLLEKMVQRSLVQEVVISCDDAAYKEIGFILSE